MLSNLFIQLPAGEKLSALRLTGEIKEQLNEIISPFKMQQTAAKESGAKKEAPAAAVLFYGAEETGKSKAAAAIGKELGSPVYRVEWSAVVSKYIGETEKKLDRLFKNAEDKNAILLFEEADALFAKRTRIRDAHDRYANQEVAYLQQRIAMHEGLVIFTAKTKTNIDPAFIRRLRAVVSF